MEKVVVIDETEVTMRATAATLIRYRSEFNRDLIKDLQSMGVKEEESELADGTADTISRLAYIMANPKKPFLDWLDQFTPFGIVSAGPEILLLWTESQKTLVEGKKK